MINQPSLFIDSVQNAKKQFVNKYVRNQDLKNNMISFITELMNMFQYMVKLKKQGKLSSGKGEQKSGEIKKMGSEKKEVEAQQESIQKPENKFLKEEVKRILTLMNKI